LRSFTLLSVFDKFSNNINSVPFSLNQTFEEVTSKKYFLFEMLATAARQAPFASGLLSTAKS